MSDDFQNKTDRLKERLFTSKPDAKKKSEITFSKFKSLIGAGLVHVNSPESECLQVRWF